MQVQIVIFIVLLLATQPVFAEDPIDTATSIRATAMRAEPTTTSKVVKQLVTNISVVVFERQRLWVRIATADDLEAQGWLRFTELRFGTGTAVPTRTPKSGGFAGFSRSVSGFLSSFRGGGSRTAQRTSTMGIRGLAVADLQAAQPDTNALAAISRYSISAAEAEQFAGAGGLSAQRVPAGSGK